MSVQAQANEALVGQCNNVKLMTDDNEMQRLVVDNHLAQCEIYLQGAHITGYMPKDKQQLLWLSKDANYVKGKAIRGGIPICWPWFGPSPYGEGSVAHGFARTSIWQLKSIETDSDSRTHINLQLESNSETHLLWPFEFTLECKVIIGSELTISLTTHNTDNKVMQISEAIHSYFAVSDIEQVKVANLANNQYVDKLADNALVIQQGDVTICEATDRIYTHSANEQRIIDSGDSRDSGAGGEIKVTKAGANDTVVWNPWQDIAKGMADFDDLGYRQMLCVEAVNSQINPVTIEPGQSHTISQTISLVNH